MELFKVKSILSGKTVSLVADTWQTLSLLDIVAINTDYSYFSFNVETGELTIKRPCMIVVTGSFYLIEASGITVDLHISLARNGVREKLMFSGLSHERQLCSYMMECQPADVLSFEIMTDSTLDIETTTEENFITVTKHI